MRIVAGQLRGRRIAVPPGSNTRPTSDRTRQALFNILEHGGFAAEGSALAGAVVLDAFAGTGALGLEALSRGARHAFFFEQDPTALACLRTNIDHLGQHGRCTVLQRDSLNPPKAPSPCSLIFLDPPYNRSLIPAAVVALAQSGWVDSGGLVVAEMGAAESDPSVPGYTIEDSRRYGAAKLLFVRAPSHIGRKSGDS